MALNSPRWSRSGQWQVLVFVAVFESAIALQTSTPNFKVHSTGGIFGGTKFLAHALSKDLPIEMQRRLDGCSVHLHGDWNDPRKHDRHPERHLDRQDQGRVWILVNGEKFWGDAIHDTAFTWLGPNDKVVLLGNWYNESTAEIFDDRMSALWVPYASLYFADRLDRTPLDLLNGARNMSSHVKQSINAERIVAYLHTHCETRREEAWDLLNEELLAKTGLLGSALGKCNGKKHLGKQVRDSGLIRAEVDAVSNLKRLKQSDFRYDDSERMYKDYLFTMAVENEPNKVGYITEKIVNAYLAGTVPIYSGSDQADIVFNPNSFLHVNSSLTASMASLLQDAPAYERLRRPIDGVVSDESLRKFFSWHPAVWPSHGDYLRRRIMDEVARLCLEIELKPVVESNPAETAAYFESEGDFINVVEAKMASMTA